MRRAAALLALLVLPARSALAQDLASEARAEVREVLARPEFQPLAKADRLPEIPALDLDWFDALVAVLMDLFGGFLKALGDVLGGLLQRLFRGLQGLFGGMAGGFSGTEAGVFATTVTWALVVAGVALIVWLVWRLVESRSAERRAGALALSVVDAGAGDDDALARSPEDWRLHAERLAGQGERVEALRALYLELLAGLHRAGVIDYDRTRTNTAYVFDLARAHPARAPFLAITGRFDRAVYGAHDPTAQDVRLAMEEVAEVRAAFVREVVDA